MPRGNFMQTSFLGGEWSPFSQGRTDEEEYYRGLDVCLNFVPTDTGALPRRPGTRFSAHAKAHTGFIRLLDFVAELGDALTLELTAGFLRAHRAGSLLVDDGPPTVLLISTASPAVITTLTAHGWATGDTVVFQQLGSSAAAPLFNRQFTITVLTTTTFSLAHTAPLSGPVDGAALAGALTGPLQVARVTERVLPYTATQLEEIKYSSEEDTLFLFHPAHEVRTLAREGLVVAEQELLDGPYLDENSTATTLAFSGVSGSVTVTASSAAGINNGLGFQTTDVGRAIRVNTGTVTVPAFSWLRISARASATSVTATVRGNNLSSAAATTLWRLGVYSDTTGQPRHGVIHEGRLWLVGASGRIDGSRTFDFFNFEPTSADGTVADDNGVSGVFAGSGRQTPRWLRSIDIGLLIGTDGGEYLVRASSFDDPITPFSLQVRRQSTYGAAANPMPIGAGRNTLFVQSLARSVYEYGSDLLGTRGGTSLDGDDLARDARHLTSRGVAELAYVSEPTPILWARREDNRLIACTYRNDAAGKIVAWHRHSIEWDADVAAGEDQGTGTAQPYLRGGQSTTNGKVYTIAVTPFSDPEATRNDTLWAAVLRGTVVCVEYMTPIFDETFIDNEAFFVDSGNLYRQEDFGITWVENANGTFTFFGLDRLDGKNVDVVFRGVDLGFATVAAGAVTVTLPAELNSSASAYSFTVSTQAVGGAAAFVGGYISDLQDGYPAGDIRGFNAQEAFLVGDGGGRYYLADDTSSGIFVVDHADSTLVTSRSNAAVCADAVANGVIPSGGWLGGVGLGGDADTFYTFSLPERPYIFASITDAGGPFVQHGLLYYRLNAGESLVFLGGLAESPTGGEYQFAPGGNNNNPPSVRCVGTYCVEGTGAFLDNSFLLAAGTFGTIPSETAILAWPSVVEAQALSPIVLLTAENIQGRAIEFSTDAPTFLNLFTLRSDAETAVRSSRGFFLPGKNRSMLLFVYVEKEVMVRHAAGTAAQTVAALTARAALSTDPVIVQFRLFSPSNTDYRGLRLLSATFDGGPRFAGFPFPDIGLNFDGTAGSARNDYGNPSVFPSDPADASKPWYVFFPRIYPSTEENLGVRVYLWNPLTETAALLSFANGRMYDRVASTLPGNQAFDGAVSFYWNRANNDLLVLSNGENTGNTNVVSRFGSFVPQTGQVTAVDPNHVDAAIGCNYRSRFRLLRPDAGSGTANGPALGKTRRIDQFGLLTYRTGALFIGADAFDDPKLKPIVFTQPDDLGRRPLFTGVHWNSLTSDYNFDNMIAGEYRRPVAGAITAVSAFMSTQDR
jgi:hypothetical protein